MALIIFYDTLEEFNVVNQRLTNDAKEEYNLEVYSLPIIIDGKYALQVCEGYEKFFTQQELLSAVEYVPNLVNEETLEI